MTDFAAAQQRILARRAERESANAAAAAALSQARTERFYSLPPTLRTALHHTLSAWDLVKSPLGTRPAFRVGQVDAELLDEELLNLLKNQAGEGLKLFGAHLKDEWSAEISIALRAALWKLSIWDHGASYGASLQGLKYIDARSEQDEYTHRAEATKIQRALYGFLTVGGRYAWSKWEDRINYIENESYDEPSPPIRRLSRLTTFLGTSHNIAAFVSFLVFLYNGRYRTLTDRLLRMRLVPASNQTSREVSFEFLNRQLVWHAFTEFLLSLLPLVGISRWRRWLSRAWKKAVSTITNFRSISSDEANVDEETLPGGELSFLPERTCAICYQDQNPAGGAKSEQDVISAGANSGIIGSATTDITNPYETVGCGCIYCYMCLARRIEAEEGEGWVCLRCGELVKECKPWAGDVEGPVEDLRRIRSRKSIAWADEVVDKEEIETEKQDEMSEVEPMPVGDDE